MSVDMSNGNIKRGDISYEHSQIELLKDKDSNMTYYRGYGKSLNKLGKKMETNRRNIKVGKKTYKSAKSL